MEGKKVLLIVNPVSGTLVSRSALYDILNVFSEAGWMTTTVLTQRRGHAIELAASASADGYEMIVCCGGDGTLNETLTGLMSSGEKPLPLGYIPAGSTNDFAETLGLSDDPEKAARSIVREFSERIDVGKFGSGRYFSYIASFGAFTATSYSAPQELKNVVGHMAYLLSGIKDISNLKPYKVKVEANDQVYEGSFLFGSVSNTRSIGGLVKLREEGIDLDDGKFELILIKTPAGALELNKIIQGILSSDFTSDMFYYVKTAEATFTFEKPMSWSLDGEKITSGPTVTISNIYKALSLVK